VKKKNSSRDLPLSINKLINWQEKHRLMGALWLDNEDILKCITDKFKETENEDTNLNGTTSLCHCGLADIAAEHIIQECPQFTDLRNET
jgi:hypothetical protein